MIVHSEDGRYASVYVPDGESFTLHRENPGHLDVATLALRPRSTSALMALAGQATLGSVRLSDRNAFDIVDKTDGMLQLQQTGNVETMDGRPMSYWKGILSLLDEDSLRPPKSLRVFVPKMPAMTKRCGCHGMGSSLLALPSELAAGVKEAASGALVLRDNAELKPIMQYLNASHQYREIAVPVKLQKLSIFAMTVALGDIIVGRRSTLTVGEDVFLATANNVLLYQSARVLQSGSFLMLNVDGLMRGSLVNLIHRITDKLIIDHTALSQLSASGS